MVKVEVSAVRAERRPCISKTNFLYPSYATSGGLFRICNECFFEQQVFFDGIAI